MPNILEKCWKIHSKLNGYSEKFLEQKHHDLNSFAMVFNNITMVIELLAFYDDSLTRRLNGEPIPRIGHTKPYTFEEVKKETLERVMEITKWSFIHAVSSYEHTSKSTLTYYNYKEFHELISKLNSGQRVYINDIMKESSKQEIISTSDYDKWKQIIFIRNCVIHNNAIADKTQHIKINNIEIDCEKDKMIRVKGNNVFVDLVDITTDLYFNWTMKI